MGRHADRSDLLALTLLNTLPSQCFAILCWHTALMGKLLQCLEDLIYEEKKKVDEVLIAFDLGQWHGEGELHCSGMETSEARLF